MSIVKETANSGWRIGDNNAHTSEFLVKAIEDEDTAQCLGYHGGNKARNEDGEEEYSNCSIT